MIIKSVYNIEKLRVQTFYLSESGPESTKSPYKSKTASHTQQREKSSQSCSLDCGLSHCRKAKPGYHLTATEQDGDFWNRNFQTSTRVNWTDFRNAFLEDYGKQLREFSHDRFHWILNILHVEVFDGGDVITKTDHDRFCGYSGDPNRFWLKVKEYAIDRIFKEGVAESLLG